MKTYADSILDKCEKATPGPWHLCHHLVGKENDESCSCGFSGDIWGADQNHVVCTIGPHCPDKVMGADMVPRYKRDEELANAKLIEMASTELKELSKRLKRACEELRNAADALMLYENGAGPKFYRNIASVLEAMPKER